MYLSWTSPIPRNARHCAFLSDFDDLQLGVEEANAPMLLQRYTLAVFYFALADESKSAGFGNSNWLSAVHECMWQGLDCTLATQPDVITKISLENQLLNGSVPGEISDLNSLGEQFLAMCAAPVDGSFCS